jgi:ADP-ribose pyrophosphatase
MELKRINRRVVHTGRIIDLLVDEVEYPSGTRSVREVAHHPGGAAVVPLLDDGRVLLVEQLRYPLEKRILELPAGKLQPGEDPRIAAMRELEEETGWRAGSVEKLISIYTTPGFCDEELHLYCATDLTRLDAGPRREEGEQSMSVHMVPLDHCLDLIKRGDLKDSKTVIGLLLVSQMVR